jgi:hypothetical protein
MGKAALPPYFLHERNDVAHHSAPFRLHGPRIIKENRPGILIQVNVQPGVEFGARQAPGNQEPRE